jgi:hypothetical protein
MYDWAQPHFLRIVKQHLKHTSANIGYDADAQSTGLQDSLTLVYPSLMHEIEVLQQQAENACQDIRVTTGILDRVNTSVR